MVAGQHSESTQRVVISGRVVLLSSEASINSVLATLHSRLCLSLRLSLLSSERTPLPKLQTKESVLPLSERLFMLPQDKSFFEPVWLFWLPG